MVLHCIIHIYVSCNHILIENLKHSNNVYVFYVRAEDKAGNVDPSPATSEFTIDITSPTLIINLPSRRQYINGEVATIGSAFDNSPIRDFESYKLYYGLYVSEEIEPDWMDDRFSGLKPHEVRNDTLGLFNTHGLEDGQYQIRLWAVDTLGHISEDRVLVTVDNTVPEVEITTPGSGQQVRDSVEIHASIFDGLARIDFVHKGFFTRTSICIPMDELEIEKGYANFHRKLNRVLRQRDVKAFKVYVASHPNQAGRLTHCLMLNDELAEVEMQKAILVRPALKDLHQEAYDWLKARGLESPRPRTRKKNRRGRGRRGLP